jgi:hypothetical protein
MTVNEFWKLTTAQSHYLQQLPKLVLGHPGILDDVLQ